MGSPGARNGSDAGFENTKKSKVSFVNYKPTKKDHHLWSLLMMF